MQSERWNRVQDLFHRVVDLDRREREALLDTECRGDESLRAEVDRLLRSDDTDGDVFSHLDARQARSEPLDPLLGRTLGAYEIQERLGTGGMGVVYRARRADGLFHQDVAVKLIRSECATPWMLRRFEFERRTLAALQHPNIARVFDAGTTAEGSPYIVMEYVRGEPLSRHCQRAQLPVEARLRLFVEVCRAVQFAHQNLVVHCDIKPANILIDDEGRPHLLDFGIARLTEEEATGSGVDGVRTVARSLTPEYASPEQLTGGAVTTAIDVYSLGVVLYELLTGRRPFESESRSPADWERLVLAHPPERPSTRVAHQTCSSEFRLTPAALRRALRGDLDRIVLMALRREPERRYASVQGFADDVERFLVGEPVVARPDSLGYRTWKFVTRNRAAVIGALAVVAALTIGIVAARRSERLAEIEAQNARASSELAALEARHARMEADSFQHVADFLMDAFLPAQPAQDPEWQQRARERVLAHAQRVHRQYADQDHIRGNLLDALGRVCVRLNLFDDARALLEDSADIRARAFGVDSTEYALSLRGLAQLDYGTGDYVQAASRLERALAIQRVSSGETHTDVSSAANDLAACLRKLGRLEEAEALHGEALALRRADSRLTLPVAESLNNLASVHRDRGDLERAEGDLREALSIRDQILGADHPLTLQSSTNLAAILWLRGQHVEARQLTQRAIDGHRRLGIDGESELAWALGIESEMAASAGDLERAESVLSEALDLQTRRMGQDHPDVAMTLTKLAVLQHARGHDDEARARWEAVLRIRRSSSGSPLDLADALYGYAVFLHDTRAYEAALPYLDEALALQRAARATSPATLGRTEYVLGMCLEALDRRAEACERYRSALKSLAEEPGATADESKRIQRRLERIERALSR